MGRRIALVIAAVAAALAGVALGPLGGPLPAHASTSCRGCTDTVLQSATGSHDTAQGKNTECLYQDVAGSRNEATANGDAGACDGETDLGVPICNTSPVYTMPEPCDVDQEIGTVSGSNNNSATMDNSTAQLVGLAQLVGSTTGNDLFTGISGSSSGNRVTIDNGGDDFLDCGGNGEGTFCGQLIADGNNNTMSWTDGHGSSQEIFFFGGGGSANHNSESITSASHVFQWITNCTDASYIDTALDAFIETPTEPTGCTSSGPNASNNNLAAKGSNQTEIVEDGNGNTMSENGNYDIGTVTDGNSNTLKENGNSDTVFINYDLPGLNIANADTGGTTETSTPSNSDTVTISGNYDTVELIGVSDADIVIDGNDVTCEDDPSASINTCTTYEVVPHHHH